MGWQQTVKSAAKEFVPGRNTVFKRFFCKVSPQHGGISFKKAVVCGLLRRKRGIAAMISSPFDLGKEGTIEGCGDLLYRMVVD